MTTVYEDDANNGIIRATARSAVPANPTAGDMYLDDGTNTTSTELGWRRYNGSIWEDIGGGSGGSVLTTDGDLLYYNSGDTRLPIGTNQDVLKVISGDPSWVTLASEEKTLNDSSDYSSTSTSFVDCDASGTSGDELEVTITTNGGDVVFGFSGTGFHSSLGGIFYFDIYESVAAARVGGDDGIYVTASASAGQTINLGFTYLFKGLSAASHTFTLQWKTFSGTMNMPAGAGTSALDVHAQIWVKELA